MSTDNMGSSVSPPSYVYGVDNENKDEDAESLGTTESEKKVVVTIFNPNTNEVLALNQREFNQYMTITNGAVLEWVAKWEI